MANSLLTRDRRLDPLGEPGWRHGELRELRIATDQMLDGLRVSAALGSPKPITFLESYFGSQFIPIGGMLEIESEMLAAGDGARGVVFGARRPGQVGHVFNVVNQHGAIRFLDGQTGKTATFAGYQRLFLMRYR
ncbi:toxin glutamine deamidase domain-containing protein [Mycobacterium sp. ML4]